MNTPLFTGIMNTLLPFPKPNIKSHFWSDFGQLITRKTTENDGKHHKKRGFNKYNLPNPLCKTLKVKDIPPITLLILFFIPEEIVL